MGAQSNSTKLTDRFPGLAKHRSDAPAAVLMSQPVPDPAGSFVLLREAMALLESFYPAGAFEYLRAERPEIIDSLKVIEKEVDDAVADGLLAVTREKLLLFVDAHRRAFDVFTNRPPVIDMQGDLFHG
jgi:hypothetical protein